MAVIVFVYFRKLNKVTVFDPEPMPQMQEIFAELSGNQYFSKFDFCKGYWQVPMLEEDKDGQKARFEIKNRMLWRKKEVERRQVTQLVVPFPLREKVMKLAHDGIMSGHQGVKKTHDRVVAHFFWSGVYGDVVRYCHSCNI